MNRGKVILVGAGPGDAGLLTLRGAAAIADADTVVYDRLVSDEILDLIPDSSERIFVGKESGLHAVPQEEINEILLRCALDGKLTVRLKGGDSFLFGRGGEELELLAAHGIPFEIVPGITSAFAAPAYAGIPVTHRDFCSSVHIITGHARENCELSIDFDALVKTKGTLVFLMSISTMDAITSGLIAAGIEPQMPAAVIENGTRPSQRVTLGTVSDITGLACKRAVKSPALLVVGKVCSLHKGFDWFGALPLKGRRIVVTRPRDRAGTLTARLRALGAESMSYPCIETRHIEHNTAAEKTLQSLNNYEWLALTSPQGVASLSQLLDTADLDARSLAAVKIAAIGSETAAALRKIGLRADYVPTEFNATALSNGLSRLVSNGKRVLIFRAAEGTPDLCEILWNNGIDYDDIAVYTTHFTSNKSEAVAAAIHRGEIDFVCFTSVSTVRGFTQSFSGVDFNGLKAVCIGASTEKEAKKHGFSTATPPNATLDGMINVLIQELEVN